MALELVRSRIDAPEGVSYLTTTDLHSWLCRVFSTFQSGMSSARRFDSPLPSLHDAVDSLAQNYQFKAFKRALGGKDDAAGQDEYK